MGKAEASPCRAHKVSCTAGPRGKKQWPQRRLWKQACLLVLAGLLQRQGGGCGSLPATRALPAAIWEAHLGGKPSRGHQRPHQHTACELQCWVTSGQTMIRREHSSTHQQTKFDKLLFPSTRARPSSTHHPSSRQEACTSFYIASATRKQTEAARRTTTLHPAKQNPQISESQTGRKGRGWCPRWRTW